MKWAHIPDLSPVFVRVVLTVLWSAWPLHLHRLVRGAVGQERAAMRRSNIWISVDSQQINEDRCFPFPLSASILVTAWR
jgi:hypothetical protein